MVPAVHNEMIDTEPPIKRPRGRTRKIDTPIDTSLPLHPWASISTSQSAPVTSSTAYPRTSKATVQPQHVVETSTHPPNLAASVVTPVSTSSFYGQPQPAYASNMAYCTATSVPFALAEPQYARVAPTPAVKPEQQDAAPVAVLRRNLPTRKDLEFLLGGPPKIRTRSSTPNAAALLSRQQLPTLLVPSPDPYAAGSQRSASVVPQQYQPAAHAPVAGPSRLSAQSASDHAPVQGPDAVIHAPAARHAHAFPADADFSNDYEDNLPLGAEAMTESDHDSANDLDDDVGDYIQDDPNDLDFRPAAGTIPKRTARQSNTSDNPSTPPRGRGRGRRSLASSSTVTGKVPGSSGTTNHHHHHHNNNIINNNIINNNTNNNSNKNKKNNADPSSVRLKRGRPAKDFYTPEMLEKIKLAEEILAMAEAAGFEGAKGSGKTRLDDIIDRKTRERLSPEMQAVIIRVRNAQVRKRKRDRLKEEERLAKLNGALPVELEGGNRTRKNGGTKIAGQEKQAKVKAEKMKGLVSKGDDDDATSGSAIIERARGKVNEWMKSISSEAGQSEEWADESGASKEGGEMAAGDDVPTKRVKRTYRKSSSKKVNSAIAAAPRDSVKTAISPQPSAPAAALNQRVDRRMQELNLKDDDEKLSLHGFFTRFATVTGKETNLAEVPADDVYALEGARPEAGGVAIGIPGDEYYFST